MKQNLPILYNDETISNVQEEKRKQIKSKEQEEKKRLKQKDEYESNKSNEIHQKGQEKMKSNYSYQNNFTFFLLLSFQGKDIQKRQNSQDHFISSLQKQQEKEFSFEKNSRKKIDKNRLLEEDEINLLRQYEHQENGRIYRDDNHRQRKAILNEFNRNVTNERYGSGHSSNVTSNGYENNRRQQRKIDSIYIDQLDEINGEQKVSKSKSTGVVLRNKTQNVTYEKNCYIDLVIFFF